MINLRNLCFSLLISTLSLCASDVLAENIVLHTPGNFQVLSVSPNGKWACGVFIDATNSTNPFRWNLESGSIDILGTSYGTAWDVANDGTVSGDYPDTRAAENGAATQLPCYWRGLTRYPIELPAGTLSDGVGCGISTDGRFMSGSICCDGIYTPFIWNEGKLYRSLNTGNHAIAFCISPDGQAAAGYDALYNRVACYWPTDGGIVHFKDSKTHYQGPWNYSRNFSPNGKKLVYWGGWELADDNETLYLYSIYDTETGERKKVVAPDINASLEFYDVSNNELLVGTAGGRGYVDMAGKGMYVDEYLQLRGIDLRTLCDDMYAGEDYYVGQLPIANVLAVSEDEKVIVMQYYNTKGETAAMAVKIDQDFTNIAPTETKVAQLDGLHTVGVTWKRPIGANNIRGYNVYRDGKKLNILPLNQLYYYDANLANGDYTYEVSAVTTANVETKAPVMDITVKDAPMAAPYSLFARQKGINTGFLTWKEPMSNIIHKRYYNLETTDYSGFSIYDDLDIELAISYTKEEMKNYANCTISEVSFVPLGAHKAWKVNLYTHDANGALSLLYSQPITEQLVYGTSNTVKLTTPQAVPQGDLVVAIEIETDGSIEQVIGTETGASVPGHSDLLRQKTESDFTSAYDSSLESSYSLTCLSWTIDLGLEEIGTTNPNVAKYNITINGDAVGSTNANTFETSALADGTYTVGIEAEYSDGKKSTIQTMPLTIAANYPAVTDLKVTADASATVSASWNAPKNNDATFISHASIENFGRGIHGNESTSYAFMIASEYQQNKLRGYDGYRISAFRFYPMSDAIFTFFLYENDKLVCELEAEDLEYKQWNTCYLPKDIYINENSVYRLVIDCFDPEPETEVLALDNGVAISYVSDLVSTDNGQTWNSFSIESGAKGSWMMGMQIESPTEESLTIDGYDVAIDDNVVNTEKLTATSYAQKMTDSGSHSLRVNTWYPGVSQSVKGEKRTFTIGLTGINNVAIDGNIHLKQGTDYLQIEGKGVQSVTIFNASGAIATKVIGSKVDISSLPTGIYLVQIQTINGNVTRRIAVEK